MLFFVSLSFFLLISDEINARPSEISERFEHNDGLIEKEVPVLENAVLNCSSIDDYHNFYCWYHLDSKTTIGPYNDGDFDYTKYGYEVLSGNLTIRNITKKEEGLYNCVSRGVKAESIRITSVKVTVTGHIEDPEEEVNSLKIILAIFSLVLFCSFVYVAYRVWKDRFVHPSYLEQFDDEDEENNTEEIYRAPSTSGLIKPSIVKEKPQDYERPLISTDFNSILDSRI